jgi:5-keto-L-gluconate epimerase
MMLSITMIDEATSKVPVVFRGKYEHSIQNAAEIGYEAIELHLDDPNSIDKESFIRLCKEYNIKVTSIGTGPGYGRRGLSLSSSDEMIRQNAIGCLKDHISLAAELNSVVIVGLLKGQVSESEDRTSFFQRFESSLCECLKFAEEKNVILVLEAINRYESDSFNTIEDCVNFIKKLNTSHLKVHIDSYHMNIEEDKIFENIRVAGDYIGHVHLADSNRWYPGKGHFDFVQLLKVLEEIDYKGALALECLSLPNQQEAAEKAYACMSAIMPKGVKN